MWRASLIGVLILACFACSDESLDENEGTVGAPPSSTTTGTVRATAAETTVSSPTTGTRVVTSTVGDLSTSTTAATSGQSETTDAPLFQVLVFHKTSGFTHESIAAGIEALADLGEEHGYAVTATDDAAFFTDARLEPFQVIVFLNTTGDILDSGQQEAMERFVQDGKGFVGIHSASDTEYEWPWYGQMMGAYFEDHPPPQSASVEVVQPQHPAMSGMPSTFQRFDEWYNFAKAPDPGVEILATLDESSYDGGTMGEPHPIIWAQEYDGGRSLYTGFGHTTESFSEPLVLEHLANGIRWAAGRE